MTAESTTVPLLPGEVWWGGAVADGQAMPFGASPHARDLAVNAGFAHDASSGANQSAPLLLSSAGRSVWSDAPFAYAFDGAGGLALSGAGISVTQGDSGLAGAFRSASRQHFPPSGRTPARALLEAPQYNTWIELPYRPTQEGVLGYVRDLLDAGFPPGVVMIDDRWSVDYGDWRFDPAQFPDPSTMIDTLHGWGCAVMLWLVPFVSPDSANFRHLEGLGALIRQPDGEPVVRRWWNGFSAILDLTDPAAVDWISGTLDRLVAERGVDGFKFDAGDLRDHRESDVTREPVGRVGQCEAWARLGLSYAFNEFRACWKLGGQPLAQRLHDKPPVWGAGGLGSLIPEAIAQGLIGHPYVCPDMIGGGDLATFTGDPVDQELFVRYAQVAALFPMMQFSMSPHRLLDHDHLAAVRAAVGLHQELVPEILALADTASRTGEPILRPLAWAYAGHESVRDQFLLGPDLLCAPVLEPGATSRRVIIPPGRWTAPDGTEVEGPTTVDVPVGLDSIPRWRRK